MRTSSVCEVSDGADEAIDIAVGVYSMQLEGNEVTKRRF